MLDSISRDRKKNRTHGSAVEQIPLKDWVAGSNPAGFTMRVGHTTARRGKDIIVIMKDGSRSIDKFVDKKSKFIFFETLGKVPKENVKALVYIRNQSQVDHMPC